MSAFEVDSAFAVQTRDQRCACKLLFAINGIAMALGATMLVVSSILANDHSSIAGTAIGSAVVGSLLIVVAGCGFAGARNEYKGRSGKRLLLIVRVATTRKPTTLT